MKTFQHATSLFDLQYISAPTVSKDNKRLFYVHTTINPYTDTYQSTIKQKSLSTNKEHNIVENGFINKSPLYLNNQLIYLSNISGKFQIYLYDFESLSTKQLTYEPNGIRSITLNTRFNSLLFTTELSQDIEPNQQSYKFTSTTAPYYRFNQLKYQADGIGFVDTTKVNYLCEYSLTNGETTILTPQSTGYGLRRVVSVSSDGQFYLIEQLLELNDDYNSDTGLFIYNRETSELTWLTKEFPTGIFGEAVFSPDHSHIAFIGNPLPYETSNQFNLYLYDFNKRIIRNLSKEIDIQFGDNSVSDIFQNINRPFIQWHPNSQSFYVMTSEYGQVFLNEVNLSGRMQRISPPKAVVKEYTLAPNGDILATISSPNKPIGIYKYDGTLWKEIETETSSHYDNFALCQYTEIETEAEDGGIIHGLIVFPNDFDSTRKYPLILNIHGGPYTMHSWNFFHEAQYLAVQGYVVLLINPRGSYGYGQTHTKGVYERYGEEDFTDLMSAVDYVIKKYSYIDEEQLFVTGGSYGGYMTNWIVTQTNRFKAGVSQRSMSNFVSMFGTSDIGYFFYKEELGLDLSNAEQLWKKSPLAYVENVETPLLLIHAMNDLRCQFDQAQQFYVGLKHFKKEAELLVFPDSSHELSRSGRPSYRVARLEAILEWFERFKEG